MRRTGALFLFALVSIPRAAWPQGNALGPEFRVNTFTTSSQQSPATAFDSSGNFIVVWNSLQQDGSGAGVFGQRYASSGAPLGPEFRVNTYTTFAQSMPSVAADSAGNFIVVWNSQQKDGSGFYGVFGQRYASSGAPAGPEFRVNTYTTDWQVSPSVAADPSGNFVVVWASFVDQYPNPPVPLGIFGQRYASSGAPLGPEFRVNTDTASYQSRPSVTADSSGNFVVVWTSTQDGSGAGVFGQRYASSGTPLGPEFRVNTYTTGSQFISSVAADSSGNFVVVWEDDSQDDFWGIFGQRYAGSGTPLGPEFQVHTYVTNQQRDPFVAADSSGNFVVVWYSATQDGSFLGIFGQRYASSGTPLGPEFRVNTYTTGPQRNPSVAADSSGNFFVVWEDDVQDGLFDDVFDVFGQRYGRIVPVELIRLTVE